MPSFESFLAEQQTLVEDLERRAGSAYWKSSISGAKEDELVASALMTELQTNYSSAESLRFLLSIPVPDDPDLKRQRQILTNAFKAHQSDPEIIARITSQEMEVETLFANHRALLRGKQVTDNEIYEILAKSGDSELREEAWEGSKLIGAAASGKVLDLVRLRNLEARRQGYDNYYAMQIELQELDEDLLFRLFDTVSDQLDTHFISFKAQLDSTLAKKFAIDMDQLRPWHYSNPFFQDVPAADDIKLDSFFAGKNLERIAAEFFSSIGFDIESILRNSDLYAKPGKNQHAYCTLIGRRTHDIRMLCNIVSNAQWMGTLLHELGHAVYDDHIDDKLPFFLRECAHTMTTEAIAEMMGRFVNDPEWLTAYAGVDKADATRLGEELHLAHRGHMLVFTQWVQVMAHFERELYRNPEQDLDLLWWNLVEKYQHLHRPTGQRKSDWAAKIHLATSPVYYHNYLLGEFTASQIIAAIKRTVAPSPNELVTSPRVGEWLINNIFRHGARFSWNELLKRATGEELNPAHFVNELVVSA